MFTLMPRRREAPAVRPRRESTPFDFFRREFASLFDRAFPGWPIPFEGPWAPNEAFGVELEKKEGEWVVKVPVPGFEPTELEVTLCENVLTIRAEHKEGAKKEGVERPPAQFEEVFTLPEGFEPEKVAAHYRNGILEVHLPLAAGVKPRRIEVVAGP